MKAQCMKSCQIIVIQQLLFMLFMQLRRFQSMGNLGR